MGRGREHSGWKTGRVVAEVALHGVFWRLQPEERVPVILPLRGRSQYRGMHSPKATGGRGGAHRRRGAERSWQAAYVVNRRVVREPMSAARPREKAVRKYLEAFAEPEARLVGPHSGSRGEYRHVLCIPASGEDNS